MRVAHSRHYFLVEVKGDAVLGFLENHEEYRWVTRRQRSRPDAGSIRSIFFAECSLRNRKGRLSVEKEERRWREQQTATATF